MAFCTVCAHKDRGDIDLQLALQVVNLSAVAKAHGLKRDAIRRHRERHLPQFLPAFARATLPLEPGTIAAEAERLYLTALDALAHAEAGVLVSVKDKDDGSIVHTRKVNVGAVARMIRESRASLDLLHKLSVASGASNPVPDGVDRALDERIAVALEKVAARGSNSTKSIDSVMSIDMVEYADVVDDSGASGAGPTAGPSTAATGCASRDSKESQIGREQSEHDGGPTSVLERPRLKAIEAARSGQSVPSDAPFAAPENSPYLGSDVPVIPSNMSAEEARKFYEDGPTITNADRAEWRKVPTWDGNPAASDEERKAAGFEPLPLSFPRRADD